jgi:hypothetical protein
MCAPSRLLPLVLARTHPSGYISTRDIQPHALDRFLFTSNKKFVCTVWLCKLGNDASQISKTSRVRVRALRLLFASDISQAPAPLCCCFSQKGLLFIHQQLIFSSVYFIRSVFISNTCNCVIDSGRKEYFMVCVLYIFALG